MPETKPIASLSLDLDNKWSYLKTHGDSGWEKFPSYLDFLVPRVLDFLQERNLQITFFVVGQDAALKDNQKALAAISDAGHEIGNHSFNHEPWLHLYSKEEIATEIGLAEKYIEAATGQRPEGFRGPGFSQSGAMFEVLVCRGYSYDASTFPTFIGPLARAYYFMTVRLEADDRQKRDQLFGEFKDGFRRIKPYSMNLRSGQLIEIPVTTMPFFRVPIHVSYLLYLSGLNMKLALSYFRFALRLCRLAGVQPSILLHPLDFIGKDDGQGLDFFPGMNLMTDSKLELVYATLSLLCKDFKVVNMREHARLLKRQPEDGF